MSAPISTTKLLTELKRWGIKYKEIPGWKTRRRPPSTGSWSDLKGVMWHHTGGNLDADEAYKYAAGLLSNGRSDLPGPLCQIGIGPDGTAFLVAWGRANHAGLGDDDVLKAVMDESYSLDPPRDNEANTDGNSRFYGFEIMYSGSRVMTTAQYVCALKLSALLCSHHGWGRQSVIGHGEWQPGKWDPGYKSGTMMDMSAVRNDVKDMIENKGEEDEPEEITWLKIEGYMPELHHGDDNWYVRHLQNNLNRFISPNLKVDGIYGDSTAKAVHRWYKETLDYTTTTGGKTFGADGWRRVLSISATKG